MLSFQVWANPWQDFLAAGVGHRLDGNLSASISILAKASKTALSDADAVLAAAELGASYLQAQRLEDAEKHLQIAYAALTGEARARIANDLGNLAVIRGQTEQALNFYREVQQLASAASALSVTAKLNRARLAPVEERLDRLQAMLPDIVRLADESVRAQLLLNLGIQAQTLGQAATPLAYTALDQARTLAAANGQLRSQIAALAALGQLYAGQQRWQEALDLNQHGLQIAHSLPAGPLRDLLLQLEWGQGRALSALGRADAALAAYRRATDLAQVVRLDLPIQMSDGRSSYQAILLPLFLEYVELLLDVMKQQPAEQHTVTLQQVRHALETLRQVEMQDFLGDRCSIEESGSESLEQGAAILYPIVLRDRLDLLVETRQGLFHRSVAVKHETLARSARDFAAALREGGFGYKAEARRLYDWLLRPVEDVLSAAQIHTLVIAADGVLRLIPFAALHDGERFLVERYGVASVTGMTMTNLGRASAANFSSLLAGVAEPGPVIDKLAATDILRAASGASRGIQVGGQLVKGRSLRSASGIQPRMADAAARASLQQSLALPGVREEIQSIGKMLGGRTLLDESFTVNKFRDEAEGGSYRVVHIASHGVFGGSADTSFILAYDDLLGINRLQSLLQSENLQTHPIELLTLSACETADGNERAPLGISGAAIRARAKSVLGTLWPVEDNAARSVMETFYRGLAQDRLSKARALQSAQRELIDKPEFAHPFFWAPFSLIGNWR